MKRYIPIFFVILLCACELVVDVDIPIEQRQLVLNSFFTPDSVWRAKLTLSRHILDQAPYQFVEDAEIMVFDGETPIATLHHDSLGYYRADNGRPQHGRNYSIRAAAPGYAVAESTSICPAPITAEFSDLQTTVDEFDQPAYSFKISFNDSPGLNFYQVMVIAEYKYTNPQTGQGYINRYYPQVWSDDPGIDADEFYNTEGFYFPDVLFDGKQFSVNVKMSKNHFGGGPQSTLKYYVYFRSLSKEYYNYKVTSILQDYTSGDPFAQPVKVYNNIENGFGIFGGYSQHVIIFEE